MPSGKHKSRSLRRVQIRMPGGNTVQKYRQRAPGKAICAGCGAQLHGIPRTKPSKAKHVPKTKKTNARPFGGNLCSKCTRAKIKSQIQKAK
ncbi:MAG: 50S ribosomal protein L34e [archaeon]